MSRPSIMTSAKWSVLWLKTHQRFYGDFDITIMMVLYLMNLKTLGLIFPVLQTVNTCSYFNTNIAFLSNKNPSTKEIRSFWLPLCVVTSKDWVGTSCFHPRLQFMIAFKPKRNVSNYENYSMCKQWILVV